MPSDSEDSTKSTPQLPPNTSTKKKRREKRKRPFDLDELMFLMECTYVEAFGSKKYKWNY